MFLKFVQICCHTFKKTAFLAWLSIDDYVFSAISILVSEWPLDTLELRRIYPEGKETLFSRTMEFDTAVFMGLMRREDVRDKFKLRCLDIRGFQISKLSTKWFIYILQN